MRPRLLLLSSLLIPASGLAIIPNYGPDEFFLGVGTLGGSSCVAIAPNWVITAKHVGGMTATINGMTATAFQRIDHPDADFSLLHFNETFSTFYSPDFRGLTGSEVTLVGFGGTGTAGETGITITGGGGIRRKANNVVDRMVSASFDGVHFFDAWNYDLDGPSGNGSLGLGAVANEGGLWFGDSGGGWFIDVSGQKRIVAVNSFIDDFNGNNVFSDYGDQGGGVALRSYQGFIESHIGTVPEPISFASVGVGLLLLRRKSRKS